MTKRTGRQDNIIQALGEEMNRLEPSISVPVAKGIIHYSVENGCKDMGIELAEVQNFSDEKKIEAVGRFFDHVRERLPRYRIEPDRAKEITDSLMKKYKEVM